MISKNTLALFHRAAENIPGYKDFLKERNLDPNSIRDARSYRKVPISSKKNYLEQYPVSELLWDGNIEKPLIFSSTSGSTGVPYYFPRNEQLSWQYSWLLQDYLKQGSKKGDQPTLIIIAFGMGVWIGGIITLRAFEIATQRSNYPASILPVGYNKVEIIKALRQLAPQFKQTLLVGYPPFIKEILDEANHEGISLKKLNLRLLFAAESFTETFRDYISKKTGADPLLDTLNIYGTADVGAMAYETPLSILIRRIASKNPKLFDSIFGQIEKTPTLAQYNPRFMTFEEEDGEIILTGDSTMPLIRYAVGDHGGVISFRKMASIFHKHDLDLQKEIKKAGISAYVKKHPFVYVYERTNFSVTIHGISIYPEFIKERLLTPELSPFFTEKFTMVTRFNQKHNQYLEINVELQNGVKADNRLKNLTKKILRKTLIEKSSEFAEISKTKNSAHLLKIVYWPYEHPKYFKPGVKQKWVLT